MEKSILNIINSAMSLPTEIIIVILSILLLLHVLLSIGIKKIADKRKIKYSWVSYLPIFNMFIVGNVAFEKRILSYVLLIFSLLSTIYLTDIYNTLGFISTLIIVCSNIILYLVAIYRIYKRLSKKYILLFIFTALTLGLIFPIVLFCIEIKKN